MVGEQGTMKVAGRVTLMKRTTSIPIEMTRIAIIRIIIIIIMIITASTTPAITARRVRVMPATTTMMSPTTIMAAIMRMTMAMIKPETESIKRGGGSRQTHRSSRAGRLERQGLGETEEQHGVK